MMMLLLIILLIFYNTIVDAGSGRNKKGTSTTETTAFEEETSIDKHAVTCDFYLAPSSIPGAGLGIYTIIDIAEGTLIGEPDINIIISETKDISNNKQQLWTHHNSFWNAEYEYEFMSCLNAQISSFPMGILSQYDPNYNAYARDVVFNKSNDVNRAEHSPGIGSFTYLQRYFMSSRNIKAGEEIFVDVGEEYINRNLADMPKRDKAELIVKELLELSKTSPKFSKNPEYLSTLKNIISLYDEKTGMSIPNNVKELNDFHVTTNVTDWVITNGKCFDNIKVKHSTVPHAGLGAFAKRDIKKGALVIAVPLLHIMDKDILTSKKNQSKKQLLLNYCYTHSQSTLLLCPTTHGAYINHSTKPNAKLQWSEETPQTEALKNQLLEDGVDKLKWTVLSFDIVATRDIVPGEEVFIDYGKDWQHAWNQHITEFTTTNAKSSYVYPNEFNLNIKKPDDIRTVYEEPYAENIQTICSYSYDDLDERVEIPDNIPKELLHKQHDIISKKDLQSILSLFSIDGSAYNKPRHESYFWPCHVYHKQDSDKAIVRILQSPSEEIIYFIHENFPLLLHNYPISSIYFTDKMYAGDQFIDDVFRYPISIPDGIFPDKWKNIIDHVENEVCKDGDNCVNDSK